MSGLTRLGASTFVLESPSNTGIYALDTGDCYVIDTGNNKDSAKRILRVCNERNLRIKAIINTHSHVDHIGGNAYIHEKTGCDVFCLPGEKDFVSLPLLKSTMIYGGHPPKELRGKKFMASPSNVSTLEAGVLPAGLSFVPISGHSLNMALIKTDDDVWFLGDALIDPLIIKKYCVMFAYDISAFVSSFEVLKKLRGEWFVPSHSLPHKHIAHLIEENISHVLNIEKIILGLCEEKVTFETILKGIFDHFSLTMNFDQHFLIGTTIRSYLSWLKDIGEISSDINNNLLYYFRNKD